MTLTRAWSEALPTDDNYGYEVDDYMRQMRVDVRERLAVQHKAYADETGHSDVGEHKPGECTIVHIGTKASFPTPATTTKGCLAVATDESNQLYYWNATAWAKVQEPVLITGDQTIAGAKTFSGAVVLNAISTIKDGSVMSTTGAPTTDAMISNKKYVDDKIKATVGNGTFSPLVYAGEQSVTYPNGLIEKFGTLSVNASSIGTVIFTDAFPNAVIVGGVTAIRGEDQATTAPTLYTLSASQIQFRNNWTGGALVIHWWAKGR